MNLLLCVPFGAPDYVPGPGFVLAECDECRQSVWLGPKQAEARNSQEIELLCVMCVAKRYGPTVLGRIQSLTPDSGSRVS